MLDAILATRDGKNTPERFIKWARHYIKSRYGVEIPQENLRRIARRSGWIPSDNTAAENFKKAADFATGYIVAESSDVYIAGAKHIEANSAFVHKLFISDLDAIHAAKEDGIKMIRDLPHFPQDIDDNQWRMEYSSGYLDTPENVAFIKKYLKDTYGYEWHRKDEMKKYYVDYAVEGRFCAEVECPEGTSVEEIRRLADDIYEKAEDFEGDLGVLEVRPVSVEDEHGNFLWEE